MAAKRKKIPLNISDREILEMPEPPEARGKQPAGAGGNLRLTRKETELIVHALERYLGGPPPGQEGPDALDHLDRMSELAQRIREHILKRAK